MPRGGLCGAQKATATEVRTPQPSDQDRSRKDRTMAPVIVQQHAPGRKLLVEGVAPTPRAFPQSITKSEGVEWDRYSGPAGDLIAAGLVHPDQFPPEGRHGISFVRGVPVRGNCRKDETYLRVEHGDAGLLRVYVGVPREVAAARRAVMEKCQRKEWEAEDLKRRGEAAARAKRELAYVPRTEDDYRRQLAKQLRSFVRISVEDADKPTFAHGYRLDRESVEAVLIASDGMIEVIRQATVHFDAALQAKVVGGYTATIKAADPSFYAQLEKLAAPNPSLLEGEPS